MKIFISGQISGLPVDEYTARFQAAEELLKRKGYEVVNPVMITSHLPESSPWKLYMLVCLQALFDCGGIYMLDGWYKSRGAVIENAVAKGLDLLMLYENR